MLVEPISPSRPGRSNQPLPRRIFFKAAAASIVHASAPGLFQPVSEFAARTSHTGLHGAGGNLQNVGGLTGGELLNGSEQKDHTISGPKSLHGLLQQFSHFLPGVSRLRAFYGRLEIL